MVHDSRMKIALFLWVGLVGSVGFTQVVVPVRRPLVVFDDTNTQVYYGYGNYYYGGYYAGGGIYRYGGEAGRGRDWNNYSDGRYEERGNHRGADRAAGAARAPVPRRRRTCSTSCSARSPTRT